MVDDINSDLKKICFGESYISVKITQTLRIKTMFEVITKLGRVNMDLHGLFPFDNLEKKYYI